MLTTKPRGVNDILPDEVWKWHYVENYLRDLAGRFGFQELRIPIFEHTELFQRGIGDTSDVVEKEMYTFTDRGDRSLTLRPEGTAGVARSFVENKLYSGTLPGKYYYVGPMFRYDRPQAGRYRQFNQFGIETIGGHEPAIDSEAVAFAYEIFHGLGLENVLVHLNSVGCPVCRKAYRAALQDHLMPALHDLCETCQTRFDRNPMRILDCKSKHCHELVQGAPSINQYLCEDCQNHFDQVKKILEAMGIPYAVDQNLVRGLDYYTRTAFEITAGKEGAQSAICGGGRYDNLIEEIGGPALPGIGFALGMERLLLTLEQQGSQLQKPDFCDVFVAGLGGNAEILTSQLCHSLRLSGLRVQRDYQGKGLKAQMKAADRVAAKIVLIIGDDEIARQAVICRQMANGEQTTISVNDAVSYVQQKLSAIKVEGDIK